MLNIKATVCQEEVKLKLGLWMSGMKRALMMTIGTSTDAIIPKTAQILALRDEFDRKITRLTLIALRYGWKIPDFKGGPKREVTNTISGKERIFAPADALITEAFKYQAEQIALTVRLPIISVSVTTIKRS